MAEKRKKLFENGKSKLTRDLDILKLIERQQMHDVSKQTLYSATERFLLQFQRRNVIESDSESINDNQKVKEQTDWKSLIEEIGRQELQKQVLKEFKQL